MRREGFVLLVLAAGILLLTIFGSAPHAPNNQEVSSPLPAPAVQMPQPAANALVEVVARGLEVPWAIAFAPDSSMYATERSGRVLRIREGTSERIAELPDVVAIGEAGLLGLALDPTFSSNQFLYLYTTLRSNGGALQNRVIRYRVTASSLTEPTVILDGIPAARIHDGGRIAFGPDGNLYVATGDASQPARAQNLKSLAGKILRIHPDGSIPPDNPFPNSPVYSFGHRNPQGLAWDAAGHLYATEHGPSDIPPDCCHDEVNRIVAGGNYGWPDLVGNEEAGRAVGGRVFQLPVIESGPRETWAPAGVAIVGDTLFFGGLRGNALFALDLQNPTRVAKHLEGEFGRIRDVVVGPDGALYLTTSNRDGRGEPAADDDRILRVDPAALR